ncbi:hypothetical protein BREVNS_0307 [Brevinematales bacterium NS]|nr:hypothetical protein BREVNS_0307 [Brevinematales bacterium NS]
MILKKKDYCFIHCFSEPFADSCKGLKKFLFENTSFPKFAFFFSPHYNMLSPQGGIE